MKQAKKIVANIHGCIRKYMHKVALIKSSKYMAEEKSC